MDGGIDYGADQLAAIERGSSERFAIINGGAGTGKTTVIKAIADCIGASARLCSLAGKAAARIREATGREASTIHSLLGYQGEGRGFTLNSLRGLSVIIDEASMVDARLLAEIVRRNPYRLVLVGDEAQLPPVGSGQPFHDLVRLMPSRVSTLAHCYRNSEAIYCVSQSVRNGIVPEKDVVSDNELCRLHSTRGAESAHRRIVGMVEDGGIDFARDIVVCAVNGETDGSTPCSVESLNKDIKAIVNPGDGARRFDDGDRVICTVNTPGIDCWNGTTGTVDCFDHAGDMFVWLDGEDGRNVRVPRVSVKDWKLAYALTVHKSQGSQYRKVVFAATLRDARVLLDRSMVYTAVTRARKECHIVGDADALRAAISSVPQKRTVLQELFAEKAK